MSSTELWFERPAQVWEEALPVGNGRLGAMVFGKTDCERIQLNEDTFWSGTPRDKQNRTALSHLPEARRLIMEGRYAEAEKWIDSHLLGEWNESYQPLADLFLKWAGAGTPASGAQDAPESYRRALDLETGVTTAEWRGAGAHVRQTVFVSHPDQVLVLRLVSLSDATLNLSVRLASVHPHVLSQWDGQGLLMAGTGPSTVLPSYVPPHEETPETVRYDPAHPGMAFATGLRVACEGETAQTDVMDGVLRIRGARSVVLHLAAATAFCGFDKDPAREGGDPTPVCRQRILDAADKGCEALRTRHESDHRALFSKAMLELEGDADSLLPTDERLRRFQEGNQDHALTALLFHYGRYLMIASSREGTQPANLQGIWNRERRAPWSSNYTTNINLQMNYWPLETCNLGDMGEPLFRFVQEIAQTGIETARVQFGCGGWTANHNVDLWRTTTPVGGSARWAYWPMGGAWLCRHLWDHYLFTQDRAWLEQVAYPVMEGAARFMLDWLVEGPDGRLVTCPSTSPENAFRTEDGEVCCVSLGSTMDMTIVRELFTCCLDAARALSLESPLSDRIREAFPRLLPFAVGSEGQLLEWFRDFPEDEVHHRHVSHLYGLYPGDQISPDTTPALADACRTSLARRGDDGTGWSLAWKVCLWARLKDGNHAGRLIRRQLRPVFSTRTEYGGGGGTYPNMMDAHPPFQIDGNFGVTAGIAEMLLQSHGSALDVLPALPDAWVRGRVRGLRARGNLTVDLAWEAGRLTSLRIHAGRDLTVAVRIGDEVGTHVLHAGENVLV